MAPGSNNLRIHEMLLELAEVEKVKGDSVRAGTYYKAARAVKEWPETITDGKTAAKQIKGVGLKIGEKIDELLSTGKLERLERERGDAGQSALKELQRVSGIGPKFAAELHQQHGIKDLAMLSVRTDLLNHEQKIGLRHLKDFESRIPRDEMEQLEGIVRAAAEAHSPPLQMTVCGSYRRGRPDSGDIDCLLCHPSYHEREPEGKSGEAMVPSWLESLVSSLERSGFITDVIAKGRKKCAAVCRLADPQVAHSAPSANLDTATRDAPSAASAEAGDLPGGEARVEHAAGGDASAPSASAPTALRVPTLSELRAKKAGLLAARQSTDTFMSWKQGGKQGGHAADGVAAPSVSHAPSADATGGTRGARTMDGDGFDGGKTSDGQDDIGGSAGASSGAVGDDACSSGAQPTRHYRRIDLRLVPYECYHASTLYFTGSDEHNKLMRNEAISKGYKLSEYGLFKVDDEGKVAERPESADSEEDIFTLLGMAYATPVQRDI